MTEMSETDSIRLNRFLAQLGVGSRRACDDLIVAGKVRVDGKTVREPGTRVVPARHSVEVNGVKLDRPAKSLVLLLHKPTGVVSTVSDPQGRPTVIDLCKRYGARRRLFPVGRLDVNTTGALLVTNDGLLCYRLTHPRFEIRKTYLVRVRGGFTDSKLERLRRMAGAGKSKREGGRADVEVVKRLDKTTILKITLVEGRNRQVRRMCQNVGLNVVKLKRTDFGPISLRSVPLGAVRPLTKKELERLQNITATGETTNGH
jgi:23S rRNA pseudouridine2605 synthase